MMNELDALENKVAQIVMLCHSLRAENAQLRQQLDAAEAVHAALIGRMDAARAQIEQLAAQLSELPDHEEYA